MCCLWSKSLKVSNVVWWYCYFLLVSVMAGRGIQENKSRLPSHISRLSEFWVTIAEAQTEPPVWFREKETWAQDTRRTSRQVTQQKPSSMLNLQLKQYKIQDAIERQLAKKHKKQAGANQRWEEVKSKTRHIKRELQNKTGYNPNLDATNPKSEPLNPSLNEKVKHVVLGSFHVYLTVC